MECPELAADAALMESGPLRLGREPPGRLEELVAELPSSARCCCCSRSLLARAWASVGATRVKSRSRWRVVMKDGDRGWGVKVKVMQRIISPQGLINILWDTHLEIAGTDGLYRPLFGFKLAAALQE